MENKAGRLDFKCWISSIYDWVLFRATKIRLTNLYVQASTEYIHDIMTKLNKDMTTYFNSDFHRRRRDPCTVSHSFLTTFLSPSDQTS